MGIDQYKSTEIITYSRRLLLCLLLCLALSSDSTSPNNTSEEIVAGPDTQSVFTHVLIQELCEAIADEHELDLEQTETPDFNAEIAASIHQLREHTTIPKNILDDLEQYQQESLALQKGGMLLSVYKPDYIPSAISRMNRDETNEPHTCSVVILDPLTASFEEQMGSAIHEAIHAVQFHRIYSKGFPKLTYEEKEPIAAYYQHLVVYGAQLSENVDSQTGVAQEFTEINKEIVIVFLAENGIKADDIFVRYLFERFINNSYFDTAEGYKSAILSYKEALATYSEIPNIEAYAEKIAAVQAMVEEFELEVQAIEEKLRSFTDFWKENPLSPFNISLINQMIKLKLLPKDFY